eukprot:scaffold41793_cov76-Cyclotella_meneghiniana.AAC.1
MSMPASSNEYSRPSHYSGIEPYSSDSSAPSGKRTKIQVKTTCSFPGCNNGIVQGGRCVTHGAKRRKCKFPGCDKNSKAAGLCSKHG